MTPLSVGGGLFTFDQVQSLLDRGADKVILNSQVLKEPDLIDRVSNSYGAQCVVVSIDVRSHPVDQWHVWSENGLREHPLNPLQWAQEASQRGAGEIMLTSIDRDGMAIGLDLDLIKFISSNISVPLIASGGCGVAQHFVDGTTGASAVAVAPFFLIVTRILYSVDLILHRYSHPIRAVTFPSMIWNFSVLCIFFCLRQLHYFSI